MDYSQDERVYTNLTPVDIDAGEMFYNFQTH